MDLLANLLFLCFLLKMVKIDQLDNPFSDTTATAAAAATNVYQTFSESENFYNKRGVQTG